MATKHNRTHTARQADIISEWKVVDAAGKPLGRLASEIARVLQGKHKPIYTPNILTGDYVIVLNAAQVAVTGKKLEQKKYYRHSGYPSGLRTTNLQRLLDRHPERAIQHAVKGMLPKNTLGRHMLRRMKVYAGAEHPHEAQVTATERRQALLAAEESADEAPATPRRSRGRSGDPESAATATVAEESATPQESEE